MNPIILADNRFQDAVPTATGTAAGFDVRHILDLRPYTYWQASASGTNYLTVNCGVPQRANVLGIIGHNLATASAQVSVERSNDGATWTTVLSSFTPSSDRALLRLFSGVYAQYWRLKIVTSTIAPQLAVAMIGARLEFPFPPDSPYTPYIESTEEETTISKTGNPLGTVVRYLGIEIKPAFSWPDRAWLEAEYLPFHNSHSRYRKYFFYAWDLDSYPEQVFFVKSSGTFGTPITLLGYVDKLTLDLKGVMEP